MNRMLVSLFLAAPVIPISTTGMAQEQFDGRDVFGSASNDTEPRSRSQGSSQGVRVPAHGPLRGAWPARDGGSLQMELIPRGIDANQSCARS
jgi:hypothetical protein